LSTVIDRSRAFPRGVEHRVGNRAERRTNQARQ